MNTNELKAQIRTFVAFLIIGLILGNLVNAGFDWIFVDELAANELATTLIPSMRGAVLYAIVGVSIGLALRRGIEISKRTRCLSWLPVGDSAALLNGVLAHISSDG